MIEEALESDENLDGVHDEIISFTVQLQQRLFLMVHIYCILLYSIYYILYMLVLQCIYKINELNSVEIIRLKIY